MTRTPVPTLDLGGRRTVGRRGLCISGDYHLSLLWSDPNSYVWPWAPSHQQPEELTCMHLLTATSVSVHLEQELRDKGL